MYFYDVVLKTKKDVIIHKINRIDTKEAVALRKSCMNFLKATAIFVICRKNYFPSNLPLAPHGSTSPVSDTGNPISFAVVVPSKSFNAVLII